RFTITRFIDNISLARHRMKLYKPESGGILLSYDGRYYHIAHIDWDVLINEQDLFFYLRDKLNTFQPVSGNEADELLTGKLLPPIARQEVWASGVTYFRSREARIEESKGGGDFYDRVYDAERPELFFKATAERTVGSHDFVRIRKDSSWDVPEPELTLFITK